MSDPVFAVDGQIVLVSGGSRGIGQAIARGFAERGAHVTITGREQETLDAAVEAMNSERVTQPIQTAVCDVSEDQQVASLVDRMLQEHGRIDTLINVAGVNRRKPALDITTEDYDFVMNINMRGAFLLSQAVGRHMVDRKQGSQINVVSLNTDRPLKNVLPYAASKAAMAQMTKALALEWGGDQVRVNALAPGFILTDLTRKLWSHETMQQWGLANTPQRRLGEPEDMVGTALFLAAPASAFMTGQVLYVDGGFTAGWAWPIDEL